MNIKENLEENVNYVSQNVDSVENYLSISDETIDGERELLENLRMYYYKRRSVAYTQLQKLKNEIELLEKKIEEIEK